VLSMLSVSVPSSNRRRASIAGEDAGVRRCGARTLAFPHARVRLGGSRSSYAPPTRRRSASGS
jgi:hypothetical protein